MDKFSRDIASQPNGSQVTFPCLGKTWIVEHLLCFEAILASGRAGLLDADRSTGLLFWGYIFCCFLSQFPMGPGSDGPMGGMGGMEPHHMNGSLGKLKVG